MLNSPTGLAAEGLPRHRIERAIEALIALLDDTQPDPDLEPNLGWTDFTTWHPGCLAGVDDREHDEDLEEDHVRGDADSTPSLNDRPLALGEVL
jgi:hypothetical protein